MVTLQNVSAFVFNGLLNVLFGDIILTGIAGTLLLMAILFRHGMPLDASVVVMVAWFLVAGAGMIFPPAFTILVWLVLGMLMFLIFGEIIRRGFG